MFRRLPIHSFCQRQGQAYYDYMKYSCKTVDADEFECLQHIGDGKSALVFKGLDVVRGHKVIVKIKKKVAPEKLFLRETLVLTRLQGVPNVSRLVNVASFNQSIPHALILEHDQGRDLIRKGAIVRFPEQRVRVMLRDILLALAGMHSRGVMHRDVKLNNIVEEGRRFKLIDMGLSEFYLPHKQYSNTAGTRRYMAPEMLLGRKDYDFGVDIWALGVTAMQMLLGSKLFTSREYPDLAREVCEFISKSQAEVIDKDLAGKLKLKNNGSSKVLQLASKHCSVELVDLLGQMLSVPRISAQEALSHSSLKCVE